MIRAVYTWIRVIVALALLSVLVAFALSNQQTVLLRIWPTDFEIGVELSIAILIAMAAAFLIGAGLLWFSAAAARAQLRRSQRARRDLEDQIRALNARMVQSAAPRPVAANAASLPAIAAPVKSGEMTVSR